VVYGLLLDRARRRQVVRELSSSHAERRWLDSRESSRTRCQFVLPCAELSGAAVDAAPGASRRVAQYIFTQRFAGVEPSDRTDDAFEHIWAQQRRILRPEGPWRRQVVVWICGGRRRASLAHPRDTRWSAVCACPQGVWLPIAWHGRCVVPSRSSRAAMGRQHMEPPPSAVKFAFWYDRGLGGVTTRQSDLESVGLAR